MAGGWKARTLNRKYWRGTLTVSDSARMLPHYSAPRCKAVRDFYL